MTSSNDVSTALNDLVASLECPICYQVYNGSDRKPVTLGCGHTLCLEHVHIISPRVCPICRHPFTTVSPSVTLCSVAESAKNLATQTNMSGVAKRFDDLPPAPPPRQERRPRRKEQRSSLFEIPPLPPPLETWRPTRATNMRATVHEDLDAAQTNLWFSSSVPTTSTPPPMSEIIVWTAPPPVSDRTIRAITSDQPTAELPDSWLPFSESPPSPRGSVRSCGHRCLLTADSCCEHMDTRSTECNCSNGNVWHSWLCQRHLNYCQLCRDRCEAAAEIASWTRQNDSTFPESRVHQNLSL